MEETLNTWSTLSFTVPIVVSIIAGIIATILFSRHSVGFGKTIWTFEWINVAGGVVITFFVFCVTILISGSCYLFNAEHLVLNKVNDKYNLEIKSLSDKQYAINKIPTHSILIKTSNDDTYIERYIVVEGDDVFLYKASPEEPSKWVKETD